MRQGSLNLLLAVLGGVTLFAALFLGSTPLPADRAVAALFGTGSAGDLIVVREIRLPRALAAYLVGAALGLSGAALQGLLRNPLAEPGVLGVSATSSLAATFALYWGGASLSPIAIPLAAIAGALGATTLLAITAIRTHSIITLVLVGVGISSFAAAIMAALMNFAPNPFSLSDMVTWMLGSVANRSFDDLTFSAPFIATGSGLILASRSGLSLLTLGEEAAASAGLDLRRQRFLTIAGAGLATGGAVSLAGAIGFVGIVAPHLVRPLVGHDPSRTVLPSALLAGLMLLIADIVIRVLPTSSELKLGVVASLIGAPLFIWIAIRRRSLDG